MAKPKLTIERRGYSLHPWRLVDETTGQEVVAWQLFTIAGETPNRDRDTLIQAPVAGRTRSEVERIVLDSLAALMVREAENG